MAPVVDDGIGAFGFCRCKPDGVHRAIETEHGGKIASLSSGGKMKTKLRGVGGPSTIPAAECSTLKMVAGNERKITCVIDEGEVKEWVGIGWITLRQATPSDRKRFPTVKKEM